jgi:hypothetical protein
MANMEHGPGFYLTTSESTARRYAKGGGVLLRVELEPEIHLLESRRLPAADLATLVRGIPRLRRKKEVLVDLEAARARSRDQTTVPANTLVNLLHYHKALTGEVGPVVAEFYAGRGIDGDLVQPGSRSEADEKWLVLFNLRKIVRVDRTYSR